MKKYIVFLVILLTFTVMSNAQNKDKFNPINISDILSYNEFQEIKQFVLDEGQTQTYCNRYNDNPYYLFNMDKKHGKYVIKLYLNPILQFPLQPKNPEAYDEIYISPFVINEKSETREIYLIPSSNEMYNIEDNSRISIKDQINIASEYINIILKEIRSHKK